MGSRTALYFRPSIFAGPSPSVCMTYKIKEALIHALFCRPRSDVSPNREVAMTNSFIGDIGSDGSGITPAGLKVYRTDSLEMHDLHYSRHTDYTGWISVFGNDF